jgi:hypothetical protein
VAGQSGVNQRDDSRVLVPLTRCPLCDFEFAAEPFTVIEIGDIYGEIRLWVSWCEEHRCCLCPACSSCQSLTPTPERIAMALERRAGNGV